MRRVFELNETAYMVLDLVRGLTLEKWLRGLDSRPTQDELDLVAGPLLSALELVHENRTWHLDFSPENVMIRAADGAPILLDFGASRFEIKQHSQLVVRARVQERVFGAGAVHVERGPIRRVDRHLRVRRNALPGSDRRAPDGGNVAPAFRRSRAGVESGCRALSRRLSQGDRCGVEAAACGAAAIDPGVASAAARRRRGGVVRDAYGGAAYADIPAKGVKHGEIEGRRQFYVPAPRGGDASAAKRWRPLGGLRSGRSARSRADRGRWTVGARWQKPVAECGGLFSESDCWGAVVNNGGNIFARVEEPTRQAAEAAALRSCTSKLGGAGCEVIATISKQQCWSLAEVPADPGRWKSASGETMALAQKDASWDCERAYGACQIALTFCADGRR